MRTYGREWQTSDVEATDELIEYLKESDEVRGHRVISSLVTTYNSEAHWQLDCENTKPHAHIWLKWEVDDASA
jgi:hypothetical protein